VTCQNCQITINETIEDCLNCGFPISGSQEDKTKFIAAIVTQEGEIRDAFRKLNVARGVLVFLAVFHLLIVPLLNFSSMTPADLYYYFISGGFFAFCAALSFKFPSAALGISLGVIVGFYVLLASFDISLLLAGWLWKIVILAFLTLGLVYVLKSKRILAKNSYLASKFGKSRKVENLLDSEL